ncbi:MAG TPA: hypothetical protein ENG95_02900 [Nitrospirae bacterium]|nr:hypothetical protein BMS3Abin10_02285 [bacterium BMS3Abin10]GBE38537.1 hypothetical protein BMS3Bbin08_01144 [bacterium BMS3Bbin08]HDH00393.1 hypothetical protein [Nitrospirota bacterium]HDH50157.1 hypothetical protein [Nitrospirota bacterium]HDO25581.1 hypothetical protein [Nitrospirota bacterium]
MNKLILTVLIFTLALPPAFAGNDGGQNKVRSFGDGDLEKYTYPSGSSHAGNDGLDRSSAYDRQDEQELKRYVIPYKAYEGTARRIIIPVTFNRRYTVPMLLDTGAPGMHISRSLAEKLGIFKRGGDKLWVTVGGIGGLIPAVYTIIDSVQVGEARDNFVPTVVSPAISDDFEGLIGMDFMANYSIRIDTGKHVVVLEELPPDPRMPGGHDETWWRMTFQKFKSMRSSWKEYRKYLDTQKDDSKKLRQLKDFADTQYKEAQDLYDRLWVYASKNAVPNEWR